MLAPIAFVFRSLNSQLLYRRGLINKFLKGVYFLSVRFFKWWTNKKRPPQLTVIRNYDSDLKIQLDISKKMGASMYWTGFHELNEMRFLNMFLKPEMFFVDVGANQGEFALFAAKRLTKGKVFAFEPMSLFYNRLIKNVALNNISNILTFKLGLSDRDGEVPIYFDDDNELNHEGLASLYSIHKSEQQAEFILLTTLDKIVELESIPRVDFIKIDVEGAEWDVLKGSQQLLRKFKPALMVELNDETAEAAGYKVKDMIDWLTGFNYQVFTITKGGISKMEKRPAFCNAIFIAKENI